ncbi:unnamed protein product [Ectocarpus sp. 12 AP-2014]
MSAATKDDDYFLGGLAFSGTGLFNWHPVLMVAGLVVAYTQGILAYRTLSLERETNKMIHNACMFVAVILVSLGLIAVFQVRVICFTFYPFLSYLLTVVFSFLLCDPDWRVNQRCGLAPTVDGASPHTYRHAGLRKTIPPNMKKKKRGLSVTHSGWHFMSRTWVSSKARLPPRSPSVRSTHQYHNEELYANLYTMHSWAGIVVVTLFYANYVGGFFNFFTGSTPQWMKAQYLPNHVFIGIFTYFAAAFTALLGIQDKNSALGCGYDITLTEPDYNPASHYSNLYAGCRLSNGLGIVVIVTCLCATYAVMPRKPEQTATALDAPLL